MPKATVEELVTLAREIGGIVRRQEHRSPLIGGAAGFELRLDRAIKLCNELNELPKVPTPFRVKGKSVRLGDGAEWMLPARPHTDDLDLLARCDTLEAIATVMVCWKNSLREGLMMRVAEVQDLERYADFLSAGRGGASGKPDAKRSRRRKATNSNDALRNDWDCVEIALRELGRRVPGKVLMDKAFGKYNSRNGAKLATFVKMGKLTNRQDTSPKGYGLPEWDGGSNHSRKPRK